MRTYRTGVAASVAVAFVIVVFGGACSNGGDDDDGGASPGATASRTNSAGTAGPETSSSPGRGTPGPLPTPVDGERTPAPTAEGGGAGSSNGGGSASTPSAEEATIAAEVGGDIAGGDTSDPREPVSTIPPANGSADPANITDPQPNASGVEIIVDLDASTPGIQSERTVSVGDMVRVAIVATNLSQGVGAFNFFLDYDRTRVVAPSYAGGSSTDRNPDMNNAAMGDGWTCLPAPEGDVDDPGGIEGDGNPLTGRALLSCFSTGGGPSGTLVLATVEFIAVEAGTTQLSLNNVSVASDDTYTEIARCETDTTEGPPVPCHPGTILVQ
jgi:hypothetical protein